MKRLVLVSASCVWLLLATGLFAQSDQECMMCHGDSTMIQGMGVENWEPLVLDTARYRGSTHREMGGCISCHSDISEYPHPEQVMDVDCGMCHYDA